MISNVCNNTKSGLLLRILLAGFSLFSITFLVYLTLDNRSVINSYYGACMLVSLQGQDDTVESNSAKILIGLLAIISGLVYAVSVWTYNEKYLHNNEHYVNVINAIGLGSILWVSTFLTYYLIENRNLVDSFYGTCMLISLQGQDDKPNNNITKILIGIFSIISSFLFGIMVWIVIEYYAKKKLNQNDFEVVDYKQLDDVDNLLLDDGFRGDNPRSLAGSITGSITGNITGSFTEL